MLELIDVTARATFELSSVKMGTAVSDILDDELSTFWQSYSWSPHFVTITFAQRTTVRRVAIYVSHKLDDSYTPAKIAIRVGDHPDFLTTVYQDNLISAHGWINFDLSKDSFLRVCSETAAAAPVQVAGGEPGAAASGERGDCKGFQCCCCQLKILGNLQNGQDSHIRRLKIFSDASALAAD